MLTVYENFAHMMGFRANVAGLRGVDPTYRGGTSLPFTPWLWTDRVAYRGLPREDASRGPDPRIRRKTLDRCPTSTARGRDGVSGRAGGKETDMTEAPDFSRIAASYAASRPRYPAELFDWLASVVARRELAWDAATGNGQAALGLATHFDRVIATDRSEAQIRHATPHPRVEYRVAPAEASGLAGDSADLAVAAAALHWFDLPRFYEEVVRVTRSGGVVAAWTYHVAHVEPPFDAVLWPFYHDVVGPHFAAGARWVDGRYEAITLPGRELEVPAFTVSATWTAREILDFVRTWSGVQTYTQSTGKDPVVELAPAVERACGSADSAHRLRWPLYLRASRV
jgi:SAM-dependent methyltransferase